MNSEMVSVIIPCYNAEQYIAEAISSVQRQTYTNWELLVVDDCSTDNSIEIIQNLAVNDPRIKLHKLNTNSGTATKPRNKGIELATGDYIAFLDSDDRWYPAKLEKQLKLLHKKNTVLVFTDYEKMDADGKTANRQVLAPLQIGYKEILTGNVIGCLTALYSVKDLGKLYLKPVGHEDFALWLEILKKGYTAYNVGEVLACYRVGNDSLSSNKWRAMYWTWNIYRETEKIPLMKSIYLFSIYSIKAFVKYLK